MQVYIFAKAKSYQIRMYLFIDYKETLYKKVLSSQEVVAGLKLYYLTPATHNLTADGVLSFPFI